MSSLKLSVTQKRTAIIFSVIIFTFAVMFTKVFLTSTKSELQAVAQNQSTYSLTATQNRGYIYDCNLKPLVNEKSGYMLAVAPSNTAASALLPTVKTKDERDSLMTLFESGRPFLYKTDAPSVYAQGVNVISTKVRYGEKALAPHIIGHLDGGGEGVTGIEKAYNDLLCQNSNSVKITYTVDALRRPIEGKPPTVKTGGETQKGVVLTLDKEIQKIIEEEGARLIEKGAIVVTETATGKIRGAASFPRFDQNNVAASLNDKNSPLVNRCFSAYNVGSVFKPIVAAAALEKGISADQRFTCDVTVDVNGIGFNCHNKSGHGEINMNTAMMRSCNPYFINLALKTGGDNIYETAVKLGLGRSIELAERMKSASGSLPEMSSLKNNAVLANFAFGQGELTATPLQIAAAISVFANGGYYIAPTLIEGVSNNEGTAIEFYGDEPAPYTVISPVTAEIVKQFLVNTVNLGSGISALPIMGGAGGKTGSAQTGVYDEKGVETVHAWFAGFFPAETPKYTVVVINEGMNSGGDYAAPVFREIADRINNLEITRAQSYFDETEQ